MMVFPRLRASALAEISMVLAITGVGLVILIGIGDGFLKTFHASRAVDDVRRIVRSIDRYGGPGLDMTLVGVDSLVDASMLPPSMLDSSGGARVARRYPVTLRGAFHVRHGVGGVDVVPFIPRDPLSYVLTVGSSLSPIVDAGDCVALFSPVLDRNISRSLPPVRVTYGLVPFDAPTAAVPDPPPPPPTRPWIPPPGGWPSLYSVPGAPSGSVWYVSPHPVLAPGMRPGPSLYSDIVDVCHRLVVRGRGVLVYYGISSL